MHNFQLRSSGFLLTYLHLTQVSFYDGMELAAGIAGLIGLADIVILKGSKYCSLVKGAMPEIKGLVKEVINLSGTLYSLEKQVRMYDEVLQGTLLPSSFSTTVSFLV